MIDGVKQPGDHKVMDIFILLILHTTSRKKPVESIFRNKIRAGGFTEVLIQAAFGAHAQVLCVVNIKHTAFGRLVKLKRVTMEKRTFLLPFYSTIFTICRKNKFNMGWNVQYCFMMVKTSEWFQHGTNFLKSWRVKILWSENMWYSIYGRQVLSS